MCAPPPGCSLHVELSMANLSLHVTTPLLRSKKLSDKLGCSVWLKMENMQNSGSFKARGIGNLCRSALEQGCTKLVSSSGEG